MFNLVHYKHLMWGWEQISFVIKKCGSFLFRQNNNNNNNVVQLLEHVRS